MRGRIVVAATGLVAVVTVAAWGQGGNTTRAVVETTPIELLQPDRYQTPVVLEAGRRAWVSAPADGFLQGLSVQVGATVKEGQEVGQLDRSEASARLKIAKAGVKEAEGQAEGAKVASAKDPSASTIAQGRLDAAKARLELAQLELDRCTLRAPFAGRVMATPLSSGQFVAKGTAILQVADASSLNALVPTDRKSVTSGGTLDLDIDGKTLQAKVQAILPLPPQLSNLHELATPWVAAWVSVPNPSGSLEPGQRVWPPHLPSAPIAVVPERSVREAKSGRGVVQVIRSGRVEDVPVRVLGNIGPERSQVSGAFRPYDALVVATSVSLVAGSMVSYSSGPADPNMEITPPVGGVPRAGSTGSRVAPIGSGSPEVSAPRTSSGSRPGAGTRTPNKPASKSAAGGTPF